MKRLSYLLATALALATLPGAIASAGTSHFGHDGDPSMFYEDLRPYGEWIRLGPGMTVWRPLRVFDGWRPYTVGRWIWTQHGWYWQSNEPFGWAVFHYGRWSMHPRFGWVWYPDRIWGPAWVDWRYDDTYIGWAPLPPSAIFHVAFGIRFTRPWMAPVASWCFVPYSSFGTIIHRGTILPPTRVRRILGSTRRGRSATIERNAPYNRGVDRNIIERRGATRIDRLEVRSGTIGRAERAERGTIESYRPDRSKEKNDGRVTIERRGQRRPDGSLRNRTGTVQRPKNIRPGTERRSTFDTRGKTPTARRKTIAPRVQSRPRPGSSPSRSRTNSRSAGRKRDN